MLQRRLSELRLFADGEEIATREIGLFFIDMEVSRLFFVTLDGNAWSIEDPDLELEEREP